jgi:hypothetical protein
MLEITRTAARTRAGHPRHEATWGIVDAILALALLPFGIWVLVIDRMVTSIAWLIDRVSATSRRA